MVIPTISHSDQEPLATGLLQEIAALIEQTGNGIRVLMEAIDRRDTPAWQAAFARWTALDQRYRQIVEENPGIEERTLQ